MIKFIGCIMILIGCSTMGIKYSKILSYRTKDLKSLQKAIMILENEIMYIYTPVPEAFEKIGPSVPGSIGEIFSMASEKLCSNKCSNVFEAIESSIFLCKKNTYIENKDVEILLDLSKNLGQWDIDAQKNIFKLTKENIKDNLLESKEKEKKQGKMFKVLGISLGATICILLL